MSLALVVELYRLAGKPPVSGGRFSGAVQLDAGVDIIRRIRAERETRFDEIRVDGQEINDEDELPDTGTTLTFEARLPAGSSATFRHNIPELISKAPQISRGEMPDKFYLVDQDYYTGDQDIPEDINTLRVICKLIRGLKELAFHEKVAERGHLSLVFIQPSDDNYRKPVVIETFVDESLLRFAKGLDPTLVTDLAALGPGEDPHYSARLGVFGVTLASFINRKPHDAKEFGYLVQHWNEFVDAYQNDLGTYLSGFAFHKAKKEVAEAEFDIAAQLSKVITDISGKLLSIPLSLAAVAAIPKAGGIFASSIIVLGLLLTAVIVAGIIENQGRQFRRVKHAKSVVLTAIQGKRRDYPDDLRNAVDDMVAELDKNESALSRLLLAFRIFSWIPVWVGLIVHLFIYSETANSIIFRCL